MNYGYVYWVFIFVAKIVFLGSASVSPTFVKHLEALLETIFYTSVSALNAFAVTSLALVNRCPFRAGSIHRKKRELGGKKSGAYR
jgi:hypothetical protein